MATACKEAEGYLEKYGDKLSSLRSGKWIDNPGEHEERNGQTLVTRCHEVIERWAEERGATPATVPGSERDGRLGVLRLDFPGYGGAGLEEVSWDDWFEPFDQRELAFIYQEHRTDGKESNFFRLENPHREDA